jgi:hypothetical protein
MIPATAVQWSRIALVIGAIACFEANDIQAQSPQSALKVSVTDTRPVAAAVQELVSRYGYVITYEDPRRVYQEDVEDVTNNVRKDLDKHPSGSAPRVIVPKEAILNFELPSSSSPNAQSIALTLEHLMQIQHGAGGGGHFRVERAGEVFHIVPTEVRDRDGNWAAQGSILDVHISLPMESRSEAEMLDAIAGAVSAKTSFRIYIGSGIGKGITNANNPRPYQLGADDERAQDVLTRAFSLLSDPTQTAWHPQRLTWQLFYDNSLAAYFLNASGVPNRSTSTEILGAGKTSAKSTSTGSSVSGTSVPPSN